MKRHLPWISALGASLYVVFVLWADRTGGSSVHLGDFLGSMAIAAATVGLGWWLAGRFTPDRDRRGIIALVVGVWGPLSGSVQVLLAINVHVVFQRPHVATALWTLFCVTAIWAIARGRSGLEFSTRIVGFATAFLVVSEGVQWIANRPDAPPRVVVVRAREGAPSVYLLVLDKYASGRWLAHTYGVDQEPFQQELRSLGFVVPTNARSNYAHTHLSLASFLNWRYLDAEGDPAGGQPWGRTRELIADARTWSAFRAQGYRVATFPNWYPATSQISGADITMQWSRRRATGFAETWLINSPLSPLLRKACDPPRCRFGSPTPYPAETLDELQWKLNALAGLADSAGPVIGFLHLMLPHEPYLFNEDCSPGAPWWPDTDQGEMFDRVGAAYATQVRCAAPMVLEALKQIIERSDVPPVIIVQSDHGHSRVFVNPFRGFTLEHNELSRDQLGERFGVFAAYRFAGADTLIADDISAVNVFRTVARALWQDTTPPLPDRSFWSSYQSAFHFTEVPVEIINPSRTP